MRLQAMGEMAATLAHEIRNPLGSMQLYCSLLLKELDTTPDARDLAEKVYRGIKHLEQVIDQSLSFTRQKSLKIAQHDISVLVREAAELSGAGVEVELQDGVLFEVDKVKLKQALLNIIKNALEAAPGKPVKVSLSNLDKVIISIEDSGPGVPEDKKESIFDPFISSKEGGTGLGLAVTAAIIDAHGGSIEVGTSASGGAKFTITL